jgi:hypothetical protein
VASVTQFYHIKPAILGGEENTVSGLWSVFELRHKNHNAGQKSFIGAGQSNLFDTYSSSYGFIGAGVGIVFALHRQLPHAIRLLEVA